MDRRDFMKSIVVNGYEEYVTNYFDQLMALYDLVGSFDNFSITSNHDNPNFITFNIILDSHEFALRLKEQVDYLTLTVYGISYITRTFIVDNILVIELEEVTLV